MIVTLELFVEDTNTVPQLRVFDVGERVQSSLVSLERVLEVLDEQVAVTQCSPGRTVDGIDRDDLQEVFDGTLVVTVGSAALCKAVDTFDLQLRVVGQTGRLNLLLHLELVLGQAALRHLCAHRSLRRLLLLLFRHLLVSLLTLVVLYRG